MVPADMVSLVVSNLAADVRQRGNHLNTGSFGTAALLPALSEHGEAQLAYAIASQTNYPSWGWWLAHGATTTWEQWVCDPSLRSHNHAFLGSVDDWFYKYLAGIQPAEPGYKLIRLRPCFPAGLTWVSAAIDTPQGLVSVDWKRTGSDAVEMTVEIPANAEADVWIPGKNSSLHLGSGRHTLRFKISTQHGDFQKEHSD
jgi:alpha-L-rhamnosidase